MSDYWNRLPRLVCGESPKKFDSLISIAVLDDLLANRNLREPYFRAAREGRPLHEKRYLRPLSVQGTALRGVVDVDKVAPEFAAGATLLFDSIDHYVPTVRRLCDSLHAELLAPTEAAAFLTPGSVQGLTVHHDNTEVFVLQLAGTKSWTVFEQVRPLASEGRVFHPDEVGEPVLEVSLEPGDCLYIPWGSPHFAVSGDGVSCHLSLMVRPDTWGTVVSDLIDQVLAAPSFEAVPLAGGVDLAQLTTGFSNRLEEGSRQLGQVDLDQALRSLAEVRRPRPSTRAGFLVQGARRAELTMQTEIERNLSMPFEVDYRQEGKIWLRVDGRTYSYPAAASPMLDAVRQFSAGLVGDLQGGLSDRATLKIVDHLVDNGVLTIR
jgi:hypothetical protein